MKQAIIDIGSNSIRLTLYEVNGKNFKSLFKEKITAGLAGYVEDGKLSIEGIECACSALIEFQKILQLLEVDNVAVFATASLRNISNTQQVLISIHDATGYVVDVISGEDEALLGFAGAMHEHNLSCGSFTDIGGASTEIVTFEDGKPTSYASYPVGCLSLFKSCVKNILPGDGSIKRIQKSIKNGINIKKNLQQNDDGRAANDCCITGEGKQLIGVGGTARATLKLACHYFNKEKKSNSVTAEELDELCAYMCSTDKSAVELILKLEPDRIHTILPGLLILQHVFHSLNIKKMIVGKYGVREGYLCQKII